MTWFTSILTFGGIFVGIWATIKYVILFELRIDNNTFRTLYELSLKEAKFILEEEFFSEKRQPVIYRAFCFFKNQPWFYLTHGERLLQAGFNGKDQISYVICARWNFHKLKIFLQSNLPCLQLEYFGIPIRVANPWFTDKIGSIKEANYPIQAESFWKDLDEDIQLVVDGKISKASAIFYGEPGNGKSSLVKYLAVKYKLPIVILTFVPEYTNMEIMYMFSQISENCIVLLEDFDNYFDKRKCIIGESNSGSNNVGIKFTFDSILNCLDGVYNNYKKTVFIMTVNDIEKVDVALKNRPSRFKHLMNFDNPDFELRFKIIPYWAEETSGLNLDQIFRMKEFKEKGLSLSSSLLKIKIEKQIEDMEKKDLNMPYI
jgi:hypothetical protein